MSYNLGDSLEVFGFFYPLEIRPPGVMCLKRTLDFEVQAQIVGLVSLDRRNLEICRDLWLTDIRYRVAASRGSSWCCQ